MDVTARATRSGSWWAVEVPEVPGVFTQARRLEQIPAMVRDAVGLMLSCDSSDVDVTVAPTLDDDTAAQIATWREMKASLAQTQLEAQALARLLVAELHGDGLTVRDIGQVLGVSPQRVSQLSGATG